MIETIYIEKNITDHERTRSICKRFPTARKILCDRYSEVFNPKSQNFRFQKKQPSLILAEKFKNFVLKTPPGYGIGSNENYYFSHMLNCLYDCRYCFLQGMYRSAHYVVFINFEDFRNEIQHIIASKRSDNPHFFSGYDCDSLAFDPVTGFADFFLKIFLDQPDAVIELRTKSTQVRSLLARKPLDNCVVAFSFTPASVSNALEHKVPAVERRISTLTRLHKQGWNLGLRFDPMIYEENYQTHYRKLFDTIFSVIDNSAIHSVSLGGFRLPNSFFRKIKRLYPEEKLFAGPLELKENMISYKSNLEKEMMEFCSETLLKYIPQDKLFLCH